MRHGRGIGLAVVLAGAVYLGAGWGYWRLLRIYAGRPGAPALPAHGGLLHDTHVLFPFAALAATALLGGICVAAPRVSPLAAGLPGLVLLAWTGLYAGSVQRGLAAVPLRVDGFGAGFAALLQNGLLGVAGLVLVIPLFVPSRWRLRRHGTGRAEPAEPPSAGLGLIVEDWTDTAPYPEVTGGPAPA